MSDLDAIFTAGLVETYAALLSQEEQQLLIQCLEVVANDEKYNVFRNTFPLEGKYSIHNYSKHKEFFDAGKTYKERCFLAANRAGKTIAACYEVVCHTTGHYPDWWEGRVYTRPVRILMSGDTAQTCRDILQHKLLGNIGDFGSGMLPKDCIESTRPKRNLPDAVESIHIKHKSGGTSVVQFKSYDQGREIFQGNEYDGIFFDEEAPLEVYSEAIIRTMTTKGFTVLTFTPLRGLTDLVISFLDNSQKSDSKYPKFLCDCSWWDVPHLDPIEIEQMLEATPPNLREARSRGIPTVGAGKIYPVPESDFVIDPFQIPKHFPRCFGMDVGWNMTAAVWLAHDRETDTVYLYDEYYKGEAEPAIHASAIRSRGDWIPGVIDPASRGRNQHDGTKLFEKYTQEGLHLTPADNAVEAGIYEVWQRLSTGRLKVFSTCTKWLQEFRLYHRDDKGRIVKKHDHGLDATRYGIMTGIKRANVFVDGLRNKMVNRVIPFRTAAWT